MPPSYTVCADVIDIGTDAPRADDIFLVDTNVWYWLGYTRSSLIRKPPQQYQTSTYPAYVQAASTAGSLLTWCGLSLAELAHIIEKTEHEIWNSRNAPIKPKEFRHNRPQERINQVVPEVETAWAIVQNIAAPIDTLVDDSTTTAALCRFKSQAVDGYDLFLLEAMTKAGIKKVLTDDGDFATVPGIQVFTCNANVISAATAQGRLIQR
ncbi:hypothetical protein [Gloeobacter violaceus]|uniref:hypothetical protein n=1 Tax=Gloeobacter violaceus TaxID=33072 RepID=UPI0013E8D951|nr:hypothetical protein [Gloeobacter violaceus]